MNDDVSVKNCGNMDIINRISTDLENEGIELSNDKIRKILSAIRKLLKVFYKAYIKNVSEPQAEGEEQVDVLSDLQERLKE